MRKSKFFVFAILAVLSLGLTLVPHVSSQPENIKVLSYSWYIDSLGFFVVVGEVQNIGSDTIDTVGVGGTVYTVDGTPQANSGRQAFVQYLVPQQKAPFYLEFSPSNSATGENWLNLGADRVDFTVFQAEATSSYQYPDLTIKDNSATVDEGVYWVSGTLQNTGTQTAKNIRVIGTFYNASGNVVGVGHTGDEPIATSLSPSGTLSFKFGAWDLNQTEIPSNLKISSYSLLIQAEDPILTGTPPPPSTTTPTDTPPSSTEPSDSNPTNPTDSTPWSTYAIIAVIVVLGFVGAILLLRKRQSQPITTQMPQVKRKQK